MLLSILSLSSKHNKASQPFQQQTPTAVRQQTPTAVRQSDSCPTVVRQCPTVSDSVRQPSDSQDGGRAWSQSESCPTVRQQSDSSPTVVRQYVRQSPPTAVRQCPTVRQFFPTVSDSPTARAQSRCEVEPRRLRGGPKELPGRSTRHPRTIT